MVAAEDEKGGKTTGSRRAAECKTVFEPQGAAEPEDARRSDGVSHCNGSHIRALSPASSFEKGGKSSS